MIDYLKNKYMAHKNRGFTLIELIVVMAIIAVLVLLAAPRFMGHTEKAKMAQIQNDVKVAEMKVSEALFDGTDVWDDWADNGVASSGTLKGFTGKDETTLYGKGGPIYEDDFNDEVEDGSYHVLPRTFIEQEVRSRLEGTFYADKNGTVYYESGVARQGDAEEEELVYSDDEIDDLIKNGYIPVATAGELNNVRSATSKTYGKGTKWEKEYIGGVDKKYIQVADINLSEYSVAGWDPIGYYIFSEVDESFTGTYDGGNYVITGLVVNGEGHQGLFGRTYGATIRNVGLIDNSVTGTGSQVGGLVGEARGDSTIENSYATGSVAGRSAVGGLVGQTNGAKISKSYATGSVIGTAESEHLRTKVGGLVGMAWPNTEISNSYATASVKGRSYVGGLVGRLDYGAKINNSYAIGPVTATQFGGGGLVGSSQNRRDMTNSYWDKETTGQETSFLAEEGHSEGKTTEEMKKKATYSGWDFVDVWKIGEGEYPKLR